MLNAVASPSPVPFPTPFVVKNGHADALIGDSYFVVPPGLHPALMPDLVGSNLTPTTAQHDPPAIGHSVARVQQQINEHLLQRAELPSRCTWL